MNRMNPKLLARQTGWTPTRIGFVLALVQAGCLAGFLLWMLAVCHGGGAWYVELPEAQTEGQDLVLEVPEEKEG